MLALKSRAIRERVDPMTKSGNRKVGRPKGAPTRYPGIMRFAGEHGYSHQHVRLVLDGHRNSRRLLARWAAYHGQGGAA